LPEEVEEEKMNPILPNQEHIPPFHSVL